MRKKLLSLFLVLAMALALLPGTAFAADVLSAAGEVRNDNGTWGWSYSRSKGTLSISSFSTGIMNDYREDDDIQPWAKYIEGIHYVIIEDGITHIGDGAFNECINLITVTIPNSVTSIGEGAFYHCRYLLGITIPDSVTSIGDLAFGYCTTLTNVIIPNSVTEIGLGTFYECTGLTRVTIPNSVTSIGRLAFGDCIRLGSVVIPDSVTFIGGTAFGNCASLTSVTIPDSVTTIEYGAFYLCNNLKDVYYGGSESQWKQISIDSTDGGNDPLLNATIHYASTPTKPEPPTTTTPDGSFTDVTPDIWYEEAVQWAADKGLMTGTGDGSTFSPDVTTSRAMIVTILARLNGADTEGGSNWYEKGMAWAVANGISDGTNPGGDISREQMAVMLYRDAGSPSVDASALSAYPDSSAVSDWAVDGMAWAVANGIITGTGDGLLAPQTPSNRAVAATILQRYCELGQ